MLEIKNLHVTVDGKQILNGEVEAVEDLLAVDGDVQIFDLQHRHFETSF